MFNTFSQKRYFFVRRIMISAIIFVFGLSLPVTANASVVPVSANSVAVTPGFQPPVLLGLKIHPENPLLFDFIVDQGQSKLTSGELQNETEKLVKYFFAALTIPDKEAWVNLSPYEKDRIIPDVLSRTMMGQTMLEQDYVLKQFAASLTNPDTELGKRYWREIDQGLRIMDDGKTSQPEILDPKAVSKVWIVPQKAEVLESNGIVVVGEKKLKVMMADDLEDNTARKGKGSLSKNIYRQIILPVIEQEVNEGASFSDVRQIYNSAILAAWYKKALKESLLGKIYTDQSKVAGIETEGEEIKQDIYEQYLAAFKTGAYNFIKEEADPVTGELIPRKYFSGGIPSMAPGELAQRNVALSVVQSAIAQSSRAIIATVVGEEPAAAKVQNAKAGSRVGASPVLINPSYYLELTADAQNQLAALFEEKYQKDEYMKTLAFLINQLIEQTDRGSSKDNIQQSYHFEFENDIPRDRIYSAADGVGVRVFGDYYVGEQLKYGPMNLSSVLGGKAPEPNQVEKILLEYLFGSSVDSQPDKSGPYQFLFSPEDKTMPWLNRMDILLAKLKSAGVLVLDTGVPNFEFESWNDFIRVYEKLVDRIDEAFYKHDWVYSPWGDGREDWKILEDRDGNRLVRKFPDLIDGAMNEARLWYETHILNKNHGYYTGYSQLLELDKWISQLYFWINHRSEEMALPQWNRRVVLPGFYRAYADTGLIRSESLSWWNDGENIPIILNQAKMDRLAARKVHLPYGVALVVSKNLAVTEPLSSETILETYDTEILKMVQIRLIAEGTEKAKKAVEIVNTAIAILASTSSDDQAASSAVNTDQNFVNMENNNTTVGGIDFDPVNMNLQIKRNGYGVPLPLPQQNLEQIDLQGLFPVIINIVPVNAQTLPVFLGLIYTEPGKEVELSMSG